jgi:hypothetical protein
MGGATVWSPALLADSDAKEMPIMLRNAARGALTLLLTLGAGSAGALTTIPISADGVWRSFDVDDASSLSGGLEWIDFATGDELAFSVELLEPALLTVVDAGFGGDSFSVFDDLVALGDTSAPSDTYPDSVGTDYDAALADARYSRGFFELAPGTHLIRGQLLRSALADGSPINATVGALRLGAIPEPSTALLIALGLGNLAIAGRRRGV